MNLLLTLKFHVNYDHEAFAMFGLDHASDDFADIAYYDDEGELVVVRDITKQDCIDLWKANTPSWDWELVYEHADEY